MIEKKVELVCDILMQEVEKAKRHPDYNSDCNNYHLLSDRGKYLQGVNDLINRLYELESDIEKTHVFMRRFNSSQFYLENEIDHAQYINYHMEVFVHKIHTIKEVMLLTLNETYQIGLSEEKCSWANLKEREELKNTLVLQAIKSYYNTFETIINIRHGNTHRAKAVAKLDTDIEVMLILYRQDRRLGISDENRLKLNQILPESYIKYMVKDHRKKLLEYIRKSKNIVGDYLKIFLDQIFEEASKKSQTLE